jgi:hypothetical protein
MIITFCFLVLYTAVQPYCTPGLSKIQACALIAQFISLFCGLCLVVDSYVQKDLISAGEVNTTNQSSEIFGKSIIMANIVVMVWPFFNVMISAKFSETTDQYFKKVKAIFKPEIPLVKDYNRPVPEIHSEGEIISASGSLAFGSAGVLHLDTKNETEMRGPAFDTEPSNNNNIHNEIQETNTLV